MIDWDERYQAVASYELTEHDVIKLLRELIFD